MPTVAPVYCQGILTAQRLTIGATAPLCYGEGITFAHQLSQPIEENRAYNTNFHSLSGLIVSPGNWRSAVDEMSNKRSLAGSPFTVSRDGAQPGQLNQVS